MGDYEYYLAKKAEQSPTATDPTSNAPTRPAAATQSAENLSKEERMRQREEEKQRQREEKGRQKRLGELEGEIEIAENALAELERRMAEPEFFADHEAARRTGDEHAALTARIAALYAEWERMQS
jgi:ATP-binding cassette subfamily F protein 3